MAVQHNTRWLKSATLRSISTLLFKDGRKETGSRNVKAFDDIPGPFRLPFLGNLLQYKMGVFDSSKYHKVLEYLHSAYGPVVKHTLGGRSQVLVFDPDDIRTVYKHEGQWPTTAPLQETTALYRAENDLSPGLGNTNGEEWYRLRSAVRQMMLRPKEVHYYLPVIQEVTSQFVQRIDKKRNSDHELENLFLEVSKWSLEAAGMVCFERKLGCMSGGEGEAMAEIMTETNRKIFLLSGELKFALPIYKYLTTSKKRKLIEAENLFYRKAFAYVNETLERLEEYIKQNGNPGDKYNFMAYLLSRKELTRKDVIITSFSLFTDGLSATVLTLVNSLYCLATNPTVQDRLYQEISSAWEEGSQMTPAVINRLHYLKAVVKETFRLYPVGTENTRITPEDLILSGYKIPRGTEVHLIPNVHFKSEAHFVNPHKFDPERWLRGKDVNIHPYILIPFGHGTRACIGRRFAEQDLYVAISSILLKFKLQYSDCKPLEHVYNTVLFPKGPVRVQFVPRT